MNVPTVQPLSYSGYRFPVVSISHCTWVYFRVALSYRDVAEMMAERGVIVSYETIGESSQKYAKRMRSKHHGLGGYHWGRPSSTRIIAGHSWTNVRICWAKVILTHGGSELNRR
jgi:predicted dienelactone hydrolase